MSTGSYDTDLTDAAWAFVAPVLPAARPGGRPRTTNLRAVLNAIFYLLRTDCQWRLLPREFPPYGTVYHYFRAWQNSGVWVHLHRVRYEQVRRHALKKWQTHFSEPILFENLPLEKPARPGVKG